MLTGSTKAGRKRVYKESSKSKKFKKFTDIAMRFRCSLRDLYFSSGAPRPIASGGPTVLQYSKDKFRAKSELAPELAEGRQR